MSHKIAVICPSNRPDRLAVWREAWKHEFDRDDVRVYTVPDTEETRAEIKAGLGEDEWIIPWRTGAIRSWGTIKAYRDGADVFIHLDDDCLPHTQHFIDAHVAALDHPARWMSTIHGLVPRGMPRDVKGMPRDVGVPKKGRESCITAIHDAPGSVVVNHGLWKNIPDLDGETQLATPPPYVYETPTQWIPAGLYFPMSYMNIAFRREVAPLMWLGLQGMSPNGRVPWGYNRFDDIWCGVFVKRICDHLGLTIRSGTPWIWHDRASDAATNARLEAPGIIANEWLWRHVDAVPLTARTPARCYHELADRVEFPDEWYWRSLRRGMHVWASQFE